MAAIICMVLLPACSNLWTGAPPADPVAALGEMATVAYAVIDADTGEVLTAKNADRAMVPASTAKIPTMVAALELLGPDYRFQTRIMATGAPDDDGVLNGDLILAGGGDPLLTPQDLMGLARRLKDLGLNRVHGRFIYDETILPAVSSINPQQPAEARYNPGVSALSVDFNRWRLVWRPGDGDGDGAAEAAAKKLIRLPPIAVHEVSLGTARHGPGRNVLWSGNTWQLGSDAPQAGDRFLPVRDPGRATAELFRHLARLTGIDLPPPAPGATPEGAELAARVFSLPLAEIARQGLEHSNNLVSELVGLAGARLYLVRPDNLLTSSAVLSAWLQRAIDATDAKTDWAFWDLPNHSGLSRDARVTARQMASILRFAHARRYGGWPFASFLPAAGFRRAFRDRYLDEIAAGRIWAKTGTLHYAKGLAGYLNARDGRSLVFALYIRAPEARRVYDELSPAERDAPVTRKLALDWIEAAERAEEAIVMEWLNRF